MESIYGAGITFALRAPRDKPQETGAASKSKRVETQWTLRDDSVH